MNVTDATKELTLRVQQLKAQFPDPASCYFIDFYCQCQEGSDYLFPAPVQRSFRLFDIVQWFFECIERGAPNALIDLMWNDVMGPTMEIYRTDESTERRLRSAFASGEIKMHLSRWDRVSLPDGNMRLVLNELLAAIAQLEQVHRPDRECDAPAASP
jgi:hypothetical protein